MGGEPLGETHFEIVSAEAMKGRCCFRSPASKISDEPYTSSPFILNHWCLWGDDGCCCAASSLSPGDQHDGPPGQVGSRGAQLEPVGVHRLRTRHAQLDAGPDSRAPRAAHHLHVRLLPCPYSSIHLSSPETALSSATDVAPFDESCGLSMCTSWCPLVHQVPM